MGSTNSPQIQPTQAPGTQALSGDILHKATQFLNSSSGMPQQSVVGFNPYQQDTMSQLQSVLGQVNPLTSSASGYVGDVLNGKYLDPSSNPALAASGAAVSSGAQRFLNQNLDQIGSNFALAGDSSSSSMANAKKSATTSVAGNVGQSLAQLYGNAYSNERGLQQNALYPAQSLSQAPAQQLMMALGLGGQQQALSQAQANMPFQNFMNAFNVNGQSLQSALQALGGINSTYYMPQYQPSQLSQNVGMASELMGGAGGLMKGGAAAYSASDRRLKTGIVKLGSRFGLGVYAYTYKPNLGLPAGERIGFMADEVRALLPRAVKAINGFLHVNHDLVFAEAI